MKGSVKNLKEADFRKFFESRFLLRGYDYFREGRVKDVLIDRNVVTATVRGNSQYRIKLDLNSMEFMCTCPCDFDCKHMAALFYYLANKKGITSVENIKKALKRFSRDELVEMMNRMIIFEPGLRMFIYDDEPSIIRSIEGLEFEEGENVHVFLKNLEGLYSMISERGDKLDILFKLFTRLFELWEDYGGVEPLEPKMLEILKSISMETKSLPKAKRDKIIKDIGEVCGDYDFFLDSLE